DGAAATVPRDLGHRTAEVQVEVLDPLGDEDARGLLEVGRIAAVELDGAGPLAGAAGCQQTRDVVALEEAPGGDHLRDVEPGAEPAAEGAEGIVGDAGHRRQYDGRPDAQRTEPERPQLS